MHLITEKEAMPHLSWQGAVNTLRQGHELPRAILEDVFLGSSPETLLNRSAQIEPLGFGVKAVTVFEENAVQGLPSVQGAMLLFDPQTGALRGLIESALITKIKTAADSLLGALYLAKPNPEHLLIIGSGAVAASLLEAYPAMFPSLSRISIWARREEAALELAQKSPIAQAVSDLPQAASQASIITTATMAKEPILKGAWLRAGVHLDLIGAFKADMREADDQALQRGKIFVDARESTIDHIGELKIPLATGAISKSDILGDLYDLIKMPTPPRKDEDITIFKNGGGAHLDLMIANYIINAGAAKN